MVAATRFLLTDVGLKESAMRRSTIGLAVFTSALLIIAFAPSVSLAQEMTIAATDPWKNMFCVSPGFVGIIGPGGSFSAPGSNCNVVIDVNVGDYLIFDADGTWQDGSSISGPGGSDKLWPHNFLNLSGFGVGPYEATTLTPYWDAVVGYIGDSPPGRGSYAYPQYTAAVGEQAKWVFPVFPPGEISSVVQVKQAGRLWLTFNADAYSNYTVDNWGEVTVFVERDSNSRPPTPDLESLCLIFDMIPAAGFEFKVALFHK